MITALARNAEGVLAMSNRLVSSNSGVWGSKLPGSTGRPAISTASWIWSPLTAVGSRKVNVLRRGEAVEFTGVVTFKKDDRTIALGLKAAHTIWVKPV